MQKGLCFFIDDDPDEQAFFQYATETVRPDIQVRFFSSPESIISYFQQPGVLAPEYLIIDLNFPRTSGLEVIREIYRFCNLSNTKVVVYSSGINPQTHAALTELNAFSLVKKPTSVDEMLAIIPLLFDK